MVFAAFILKAIFLSFSGVMAPGPLTAVTVAHGSRSQHAGVWIAIGHGIVEFPLMAVIYLGFEYVFTSPNAKAVIGLVGGFFLFFLAYSMFRSIAKADVKGAGAFRSPVAAGAILSIANPYFLIWWATVGASLIIAAVEFGAIGVIVFAIFHWLCDFVWCYFLSALSFRGGRFFGNKFQKIVFGVCGVFLIFMGGKFIVDAVGILSL